MLSVLTLAAAVTCAAVLSASAALVFVAVRSRRQKTRCDLLGLLGSTAEVTTPLDPHGAVLLRGELWIATSRSGETILSGCRVRIVGARNHLLVVDKTD